MEYLDLILIGLIVRVVGDLIIHHLIQEGILYRSKGDKQARGDQQERKRVKDHHVDFMA